MESSSLNKCFKSKNPLLPREITDDFVVNSRMGANDIYLVCDRHVFACDSRNVLKYILSVNFAIDIGKYYLQVEAV